MAFTQSGVGRGQTNRPSDVKIIQELINLNVRRLFPMEPLPVTGHCGWMTQTAIDRFQRSVLLLRGADATGYVKPDDFTYHALLVGAGNPSQVPITHAKVKQSSEAGYVARAVSTPLFKSGMSNGSTGQELIWAKIVPENIRGQFKQKIIQICKNIGIPNPNWLMACMAFETAWTLDPHKRCIGKHGHTIAIGLIQFTDIGAKSIGMTKEALGKMEALEQLDWVEEYFKQNGPSHG